VAQCAARVAAGWVRWPWRHLSDAALFISSGCSCCCSANDFHAGLYTYHAGYLLPHAFIRSFQAGCGVTTRLEHVPRVCWWRERGACRAKGDTAGPVHRSSRPDTATPAWAVRTVNGWLRCLQLQCTVVYIQLVSCGVLSVIARGCCIVGTFSGSDSSRPQCAFAQAGRYGLRDECRCGARAGTRSAEALKTWVGSFWIACSSVHAGVRAPSGRAAFCIQSPRERGCQHPGVLLEQAGVASSRIIERAPGPSAPCGG
jgi:hypothetical protein